MALRLTEHDGLSVLTADAIARYMPGMRSDPFAFRRMLNRFELNVEDPRKYGDYVKYAEAKRREDQQAREAEATKRKGKGSGKRYHKPNQERAAEKVVANKRRTRRHGPARFPEVSFAAAANAALDEYAAGVIAL